MIIDLIRDPIVCLIKDLIVGGNRDALVGNLELETGNDYLLENEGFILLE